MLNVQNMAWKGGLLAALIGIVACQPYKSQQSAESAPPSAVGMPPDSTQVQTGAGPTATANTVNTAPTSPDATGDQTSASASAPLSTPPAAVTAATPPAPASLTYQHCFDSVSEIMTTLRQKHEALNHCIQSEVHFDMGTNCQGEPVFLAWPQCGDLQKEICGLESKAEKEIKACRSKVDEKPMVDVQGNVSKDNPASSEQAPTVPRVVSPEEYIKAMEGAKEYLNRMGEVRKVLENPDQFIDSVPGLRESLNKLSEIDTQKSLDKMKEIYEQGRVEWEKKNPLKPYEPQIKQFTDEATKQAEILSKDAAVRAKELQETTRVKVDEYSVIIRQYMNQAQTELDKIKDQAIEKLPPETQKKLEDSLGIVHSGVQCVRTCEMNMERLQGLCKAGTTDAELCQTIQNFDHKICENRCEKKQ